jgi:hypothetical protein
MRGTAATELRWHARHKRAVLAQRGVILGDERIVAVVLGCARGEIAAQFLRQGHPVRRHAFPPS